VATLPTVPEFELPSGVYLSLANVVRARFGGQTRAHLMRNRLFTQHAGVETTTCCFDPHPLYPLERERLTARGELVPGMRLLNLYEYYREQELDLGAPTAEALPVLDGLDAVDVGHPDGSVHYTAYREPETDQDVVRDYRRSDGSVYVRTPAPAAKGNRAPFTLVDRQGRPTRSWNAKRGWGQHWLQHLVGTAPRAIVISDSRDALLPLLPLADQRFHVLHLMHNIHLAGERRWNSALSPTYGPLFNRLPDLDGLVTLSDRQRQDVAERFGNRDNLYTVSNPVELPVRPATPPVRERAQFTIVSRFEGQKRLDHAIRAFALVVAERPQARLHIYGQGSLQASLTDLVAQLGVADHITFCGWDPHARDTLWSATGFLVTSNFEGYPLATLESLSRGCPVVSYDIKYGPREQITDGVEGYLVPAGDQRTMADRIITMIDDPALVARMSVAAEARAAEHDHRAFLGQWRDVISQAVERRPARVDLAEVRCTVVRIGHRRPLPTGLTERLPARARRRLQPLHRASASFSGPRELVVAVDLDVDGRWPPGALDRAAVTLVAVSATSETVTPLPVRVRRTKRRYRVRGVVDLAEAFQGRGAGDDAVTLRLRLVLANASWETTLRRPATARPPLELAFDGAGTAHLLRGPAAG